MPAGYDIMLGNGSDELISLLALACDVPGASILAPLPGFVMYAMSAQLQGLQFVGVDLTADFELDVPAMLAAIAQHKPAITYLAYPNNPTANLWDVAAMAQIIAAVGEIGGLVVLDEAYQPFSSKTYLDTIRANPTAHAHVLLMRTLSKFGLAGVRMGYMMGPKALIAEIDKVRPPYNISVLNYECALFALEHKEVFSTQAVELIAQRAILFDAMSELSKVIPNVKAFKSDANMMLLRVPDPQKTFEGMKAKGVLIKNVSKMHPLLTGCLRLTVGTAEENATMVAAIKASL
jgi:histidinol-phosphate aminotransferase